MRRIRRRYVPVIGYGLRPVLARYTARMTPWERAAERAGRDPITGELLRVRPDGCSCGNWDEHAIACRRRGIE